MNYGEPSAQVEYLRDGRLRYYYERGTLLTSRKDDDSPSICFALSNVSDEEKIYIGLLFCVDANDMSTLHKNFICGSMAKENNGFGIFTLNVKPSAQKVHFHLTRACAEIRVVPTKQNNLKENRSRHTPKDDPPEARLRNRQLYLEKLKALLPHQLADIQDGNAEPKGRATSCRLVVRLIDVATGMIVDAKSDVIKSTYKSFRLDSMRVSTIPNRELVELTLKCDEKTPKEGLRLTMKYRTVMHEGIVEGSIDDVQDKTILVSFSDAHLFGMLHRRVFDKGPFFQIRMEVPGGKTCEDAHTPFYEVKSINKHNIVMFTEEVRKASFDSVEVKQDDAKSLEELQQLLCKAEPEMQQAPFASYDDQEANNRVMPTFMDEEDKGHQFYHTFQNLGVCTIMENEDYEADILIIPGMENLQEPLKIDFEANENENFDYGNYVLDDVLTGRGTEVLKDGVVRFGDPILGVALKKVLDENDYESDQNAMDNLLFRDSTAIAMEMNEFATDVPKSPCRPANIFKVASEDQPLQFLNKQPIAIEADSKKQFGSEFLDGVGNRGLLLVGPESFGMECSFFESIVFPT